MSKISRRRILLATSAGFSGLAATFISPTSQASSQENPTIAKADLQQLSDRAAIIDAVNIIGLGADLRDWTACRAAFADQVWTDYTSLNGGTPSTVAADALIAGWADFFSKTFKATQHLISNHAVKLAGDQASCTSQFQAQHVYLDAARGTWTLGGVYNHELIRTSDGWKVNRMKMTWTWENGQRPA